MRDMQQFSESRNVGKRLNSGQRTFMRQEIGKPESTCRPSAGSSVTVGDSSQWMCPISTGTGQPSTNMHSEKEEIFLVYVQGCNYLHRIRIA